MQKWKRRKYNMWYNEWGQEFETKEEAMANCVEKWNDYDLYDLLESYANISWTDIVRWAIKQPNFATDFSKDIELAKQDFFNSCFYEED